MESRGGCRGLHSSVLKGVELCASHTHRVRCNYLFTYSVHRCSFSSLLLVSFPSPGLRPGFPRCWVVCHPHVSSLFSPRRKALGYHSPVGGSAPLPVLFFFPRSFSPPRAPAQMRPTSCVTRPLTQLVVAPSFWACRLDWASVLLQLPRVPRVAETDRLALRYFSRGTARPTSFRCPVKRL